MKNIKLIAGRPLIYWALDAAVGCKDLEHVYVSTDSYKIRDVVEQYGSQRITVISRSYSSATNKASTESVMIEFALSHPVEKLVLLQATSPLIRSDDILRGIELIKEKKADSLVSLVNRKQFRWSLTRSGSTEPLNYSPAARPRRQDFEGEYFENGALYISDSKMLVSTKCRLHGKTVGLKMSAETYFEVDEIEDWKIIESLLINRTV